MSWRNHLKAMLFWPLFDYYFSKTAKHPQTVALQRFAGFSLSSSNLGITNESLANTGFFIYRLITPTLKAAGSTPVGRTKKHLLSNKQVLSFFHRRTSGLSNGSVPQSGTGEVTVPPVRLQSGAPKNDKLQQLLVVFWKHYCPKKNL